MAPDRQAAWDQGDILLATPARNTRMTIRPQPSTALLCRSHRQLSRTRRYAGNRAAPTSTNRILGTAQLFGLFDRAQCAGLWDFAKRRNTLAGLVAGVWTRPSRKSRLPAQGSVTPAGLAGGPRCRRHPRRRGGAQPPDRYAARPMPDSLTVGDATGLPLRKNFLGLATRSWRSSRWRMACRRGKSCCRWTTGRKPKFGRSRPFAPRIAMEGFWRQTCWKPLGPAVTLDLATVYWCIGEDHGMILLTIPHDLWCPEQVIHWLQMAIAWRRGFSPIVYGQRTINVDLLSWRP